jgi:superoxide reductase
MAKPIEVYKCEVCGNIVEVLHGGGGKLVCCGADMQLCEANTVDAAKEKHVPIIERAEGGVKVRIGSVSHPMDDDHYIEWIEFIVGKKVLRQNLNPGDKPEAFFFRAKPGEVTVRAYCNLHGLWESKGL